jgi:bifunctional non-homologous end joining protein LigD
VAAVLRSGADERRDEGRNGSLDAYRAKRRFTKTPEPKGRKSRRQGHLFTMQKHAARRLHYDLRLELDGVLLSWAVTRGPSLDPKVKRLAVRTEDHPVDYAAFEGTIPKGEYGAGTVLLWDRGTWEPEGDPRAGLAAGKLGFKLHGERLSGSWALVRMRKKEKEKRENWLLLKHADAAAAAGRDVTAEHTTSIATGREMDAIAANGAATPTAKRTKPKRKAAAPLPAFVAPQLAQLVDDVPDGEGWLFEPKFDGYRAIVAASGEQVRIHTRNGHDWTHRFPWVAAAIAALDLDGALLDGEITVIDADGRTDFGALQRSLEAGEGARHSLFVFDLLATGGKSLRNLQLVERKARLERLLAGTGRHGRVHYTDHVERDGAAMGAALRQAGFEGLIAKQTDGRYRSGRGRSWLKIKFAQRQEFVIVGWSPSSAVHRPFASILLGLHSPDGLRYAGRVGSGFGARELEALSRRFADLGRATSPLAGEVPRAVARDAGWLEPELVAEIGFAERTRDGAVRHGRFLGLRQDKPAAEVESERPTPAARQRRTVAAEHKVATMAKSTEDADTIAGVRLSNPDRVLYPAQGLTKRDLAHYLDVIGERMMPYVRDRLVSLVRCPQGRAKKCFFQRHGGAGLPDDFKALPVTHKRGDVADYLYLDDKKALVAAMQMGVLELHIWGSKIDAIDKPDRLVFDLDPDPAVGFERVRDAAAAMRDALDALGLESFALLTGGKGVHVVVPLTRRHDWPTVKAFARALAERFVTAEPESYVATMSKARRKNRIFIDHFRNERGSTAIAPYSPRARQGAPVAWPVTWPELAKAASAAVVEVPEALRRAGGPDPWTGYGEVRQSITAGARRALGL